MDLFSSDQCITATTTPEQPNDEIRKLLSMISTCIASGSKNLPEEQRKEVVDAASRLQEAMERPEERIFRIMSMPNDATALGLAANMDLFDIAARHIDSTGEVIALAELADPDLSASSASSSDMASSPKSWPDAIEIGRSLSNDKPLGGVALAMSLSLPSLGNMFQYFRKHGFRNPCDLKQGPWQDSHNSEESFFQWLEDKPREKKAFHLSMVGLRPSVERQWFNHFPVEERLMAGGGRLALVDVGGGMGHDMKRLLERYPGPEDALRVLDLPYVVKDAPVHTGIQFVGHDFFDPYPAEVRGAKAYYMRMILHDWPMKQARAILANVREAMDKDLVLLINESVLPELGVSMDEARLGFLMIAFCAAMERMESQWAELLQGVGFVIRRIWSYGPMSLIEAVLDAE